MAFVSTVSEFANGYLGLSAVDREPTPEEWLVMPEQHLRTVASGGIWHDDTGEVTRLRNWLSWYPEDVWRYVLAAQWRRIGQEEAFPGRCAEVGDEHGSRVVTARLLSTVMHLAFLLERQYMLYAKLLRAAITDEGVKRLPPNAGNTGQWVDSTDLLAPRWFERLRGL